MTRMDRKQHEEHMRRAIELAANTPQLPFGAVIVDGQTNAIVAEGWNRSALNPLWHGEVDALNKLAELKSGVEASGLILYTTAEPCPMCQGAILWTGIGTVVFGTSIEYLKREGWWQIDISADEVVRRTSFRQCTVIGGILEAECNELFEAVPRQSPLRQN